MQESEWTLKRKETVNRLMAITRRDSGIQIVDDDIEVDDLVEDFFKDDEDEHIFLDSILADIGTIPLEVEEASDWERAAHDT